VFPEFDNFTHINVFPKHLAGLIEITYPPQILISFLIILCSVAFARAFNLAISINLLTHYAKGTPSLSLLNNFDCL